MSRRAEISPDITKVKENQIQTIALSPHNMTLVTTSNVFLRSHFDEVNSVIFLRLFNLLASQIQQNDGAFQTYRVPFTAIIAENTTGGSYYKIINRIVEDSMKVIVNIPENKDRVTKYTLFSKCTLDSTQHCVEIAIHPDLLPHMLNLKNHFTRYQLEDFLRLSSVYSQRLFQILASWYKSPFWRVDIEDLHDMVNSAPSMRKDFKQFRVRALDTAMKEIESHTKLYFRYEVEKVMRKVKYITFYFAPEDEESIAQKAAKAAAELQKKSDQCFEKFLKKQIECSPKKRSKKCAYCLSHGEKATGQLLLKES